MPKDRILFYAIINLLIISLPSLLFASSLPHHDLSVKIIPEKSYLIATDTITLPEVRNRLSFIINKNLKIKDIFPEGKIETHEGNDTKTVELIFDSPQKAITIKYEGKIYEPVMTLGEQARGYSYTGGIISPEGVFLHGGSFWYPETENDLLTFNLSIELPEGWYGISQGVEIKKDKLIAWHSPEPQEEIYLVANRFIRYEEELDGIKAMVLLKKADDDIAKRYISATFRYIKLYENLIGPYPYKKFALVENFFESGFGMPSFTLLGPKVLRLPFIIDTSYPHEILHNWWGNSVWPKRGRGNWTEGLTAYLSDHLMKERKEEDREYRFTTLQKYRDYVLDERDFPIEEFKSRHSGATEAIGYGKSMYFFHMLRRKIGERYFIEGLRDFYRENKFKHADLDDLRISFEKVSKIDLKDFFNQWTKRKGAPVIEIKDVEVRGKTLRLTIEQTQENESYKLDIPVRIFIKGGKAHHTLLRMDKKRQTFYENLPGIAFRIDIDPDLHVFRRLSKEEIPPAITAVLGSKEVVIIRPSTATEQFFSAYEEVIGIIKNSGPEKVKVIEDEDIKKLPEGALIVLGWENRFLNRVFSDQNYIKTVKGRYEISGKLIDTDRESLVFVRDNPSDRERPLLFIGSKRISTLKALMRKLPHYHKYSYLIFEGDEATNIMKGRWQTEKNPMSIILDKDEKSLVEDYRNEPLIREFSRISIQKTLEFLTSPELKGRKAGTEGAMIAAQFIKESFRRAGLIPYNSDYLQIWNDGKRTLANVIGKTRRSSDRCLIIGAHYDHMGTDEKGNIYPGADDNASGVSLLIELARIMAENNLNMELIFIAFTGEEEGRVGSRYYVENTRLNNCVAMINLDTVGRLLERRLLIIGAHSAKEWPMLIKEASLISGVNFNLTKEDIDSSDQKSFEEAGIPAIQLSTGPHEDYHRSTDTLEKLDIDGILKIGDFTREVILRLDKLHTLSFTGNRKPRPFTPEERRKVSIGTIPDFSYKGMGYRIGGILKASPAQEAGLKEGDIIVEIDSRPVTGLKDFSEYLKTLKPGDRVILKIDREGSIMTFDLEVRERK